MLEFNACSLTEGHLSLQGVAPIRVQARPPYSATRGIGLPLCLGVQERILELQRRKEALARGALGAAEGEHGVEKKMGLEDLKFLFQ